MAYARLRPGLVNPSGTHSPRRALRGPSTAVNSHISNTSPLGTIHVTARERERLRVLRIFLPWKESLRKDWPRRECPPRRRMLRAPCFWRKRIPPSSACWGHYLAILLRPGLGVVGIFQSPPVGAGVRRPCGNNSARRCASAGRPEGLH